MQALACAPCYGGFVRASVSLDNSSSCMQVNRSVSVHIANSYPALVLVWVACRNSEWDIQWKMKPQ